MDFAVPEDKKVKIKESEKISEYLNIAENKKSMEQEGVGDTNCIWFDRHVCKRLERKIWKSDEKSRVSRLQHIWDRSEFSEKFWKPDDTCCHSYSSKRPPAKAPVKNSLAISDKQANGGTRGVIVIVVGNGHGDTSSTPGRKSLHFT